MNKQIATALKYDENSNSAPKLLAKGQNEIAEKILELAKQNNIPIKEDKDLVAILNTLELNDEIPFELYSIVAEIFALIYNINKSYTK
ncbi:MAG TPA: flagellar biosynthesis protein FlhB [Alphaproteobacteria bacterium]|nr:flagellar biosynthesis protein FlhB [Alphaproteobacteria bacterium]